MNNFPPLSPPGTSPELQKQYAEASILLEKVKAEKRRMNTKKLIKALFILCAFAGLFIGAYLLYSQRASIIAQGKGYLQSILPTPKPTATQPAPQAVNTDCQDLKMTLDGTKLNISVPKIGQCYKIAPEFQSAWSQTFANGDSRSAFAKQIGGDPTFVETAIANSLSSWQLNLREPEAAEVPVPTAVPTPTMTPGPTPVPVYENREIPLSFPDLIKVMRELGISKVVGNDNTRYNQNSWALYYTAEDYLILNTYKLPKECASASSLKVSLEPDEGYMSLEDGWLYCK